MHRAKLSGVSPRACEKLRAKPTLLFVVLLTLGAVNSAQAVRHRGVAPCEYEVYTALLEDQFAEVARSAFFVDDRTLSKLPFGRGDAIIAVLRRMQDSEELPAGLAEEFLRRSETEVTLRAEAFGGRVPVILHDEAERRRIGEEMLDVSGYPERYPAEGTITFSRVAFTEDARFALVHTLYHCGGRCGGGALFLMERVDGRWTVRQVERTLHV